MSEVAELSGAECLEMLERTGVGRAVFSTPMGVRVVPVNYVVHDGEIVLRTTAYGALGTYAAGADVAFEIDDVDLRHRIARSVVVLGSASVVTGEQDLEDIRRRHDPAPWAGGRRDLYLRVRPQKVTGRRVTVPVAGARRDKQEHEQDLDGVSWVTLRDGTDAVIWPLLPTDRDALREEYEHLSPEARFHRFMSAVPHLTTSMLDHLVDDVDGVDHVALVLFALPDEGPEAPAGIARVARRPEDPTTADVGVTVADEWQGRGVATALLGALLRRRPSGVRKIVTKVAWDNPVPLALAKKLGDVKVSPDGCGGLDVVIDLPAENGAARVGTDHRPGIDSAGHPDDA